MIYTSVIIKLFITFLSDLQLKRKSNHFFVFNETKSKSFLNPVI